MLGSSPHRIAALLAAVVAAVGAASAGAAEAPGQYAGHGISFSYPTVWQHVAGGFEVQVGSALWTEIFAPIPPTPPPADPTDPAAQPPPTTPPTTDQLTDLVGVAAYRVPIAITKKNLARYKPAIQMTVLQLTRQAGGRLTSGPTRVAMGGMPGYRFEVSVTTTSGAILDSRLLMVFKKKTEYVVNCQHLRDGPLAAELATGCDQLTQSFRVLPPSK
jgi:hypothetical protein